ncbi:MAG TPA: helix-turn-helix transcriptional regulator [Verrucomicrobiae bacterium]|nr:helix-turn-helix transcriptional regulator [Verrucomicrobiae bacterium]
MKIKISKDWCRKHGILEGDSEIGAGFPPFLPRQEKPQSDMIDMTSEVRIAFGKFLQLLRRNCSLSVEELAKQADIDASELLNIEANVNYSPEPRTVYQLAIYFRLPQKRLMQLAGLTQNRDPQLTKDAVRFAARSEPTTKLNASERDALEAFIARLSQME